LRRAARCKMEHPAGQKSVQRAPSFYSVAAVWFSAPDGDALRVGMDGDALRVGMGCLDLHSCF
jgi:hypothetical protein